MTDSGGPVENARAAVVERLRARSGELVREIFARVSGDAFEHAGTHDAEYVAGLRATVAAALEYSLQSIERGEEWPGQIPVVALEQARRAARVGVSLGTVLRRYVVGNSLLGEFVMEEADRDDLPVEREALREALRAQASVLDRLLIAITGEYGDELRRAGRSPEQRRAERVKRLLNGEAPEGSRLDYELGQWHLGVIAVGEGAGEAVRELSAGVDRRLLSVQRGERTTWAWLGGGERLTFADVDRLVASAIPLEGVVLGLGESARGIGGWRLTHRQAQAALLVALRRSRAGGATRYADVALLAFALGDELLARSLIEVYLAPLDEQRDGGAVLRETLRAYLAAGRNTSSAAAALGVARSTFENRLRAVEQNLGRPLSACPAELEVALRLENLAGLHGGEHRTARASHPIG